MMTERELYGPLLAAIARMRRVRADSVIAAEFPLHGRRVDLAILTRSGSFSAIELKLRDIRGVIGQAALNTHSFQRSYIAIPGIPHPAIVERAGALGVGIFVVNGRTRLLLEAQRREIQPVVRRRVLQDLKRHGREWGDVRATL